MTVDAVQAPATAGATAPRPAAVPWRWLRLPLLLATLACGAAGQYWLSIHRVPAWSALAWAGAAVGFVVAYALGRDARELPALGADGLARNVERAWAAVVFGVGLFFGLYRITTFPPGLNHDAAWEGLYAIRILQGGVRYAPYVNMAWGRETFTFYLRALSIMLLGRTQLAVEAPSMVAGIVVLPFFYWWARNTFGARFALMATLLLGVSGWHLIFSRTGWRSDFQPLFTVITCCFFVRGMLTAKWWDFAMAGLALAVTLNTYNAARVLPALFPLWLLAYLIHSRQVKAFVRRYLVGLLAMAVTFGVAIAPLAWYAMHHWIEFQGRALALRGETTFTGALKQTTLLFNSWGNGDDFFINTPGLEYPTAIFLVFGVLWALLRWRDTRAQFILLGFIVGAVPGLVSKPNMNRDIGTMPFVYFFVALGVLFFVVQFARLLPRVGHVVAALFAVAVGAAATQATFTQYLGSHPREIWGFYPETTILGKYIKTLVPRYRIWIGDTPYFPRDAMTYLSFQGDENPLEDRNYIWVDDVTLMLRLRPMVPPGVGLAFLVENAGRGPSVLAELQRRYPKHELVEFRYPEEDGRVFAKGVIVPADGTTPDTSHVEGVVSPQDAPGKLQQPRSVAATPDGDLVAADFGNNRMQEFARDLSFVRAWGSNGPLPGQFNQPCGVAVGPHGEIFVADTWNQRVQVFAKSGQFLREWGAAFYSPRGIAVDATGSVFVADSGNDRVLRFSATGALEGQWGGKGAAAGQFVEPIGIAVDGNGQVYVSDNGNGRLQIFDRTGKVVSQFKVPGWESKVYSEPYVAIDSRGSIWLTVPGEKEVRQYTRAGKLVRTLKGDGTLFDTPIGITYNAAAHELVIADLAGRLVRIPEAGK